MAQLLIIGAGGHGSVVADAALSSGAWRSVAFVDDTSGLSRVLGYEVVAGTADLARLASSYSQAVVAIGNARVRLTLLDQLQTFGFELPSIVHPSASVSRFATLGPATVVMAQAAINPRATIGRGCIVNTGATVDHDCVLADGVHVCPGVNLAGDVRIGARSWVGIGSSVKQGIRIGGDVTIGAGAVVVSDIDSGLTVVGVPARARQRTS